jgi:TetR/AcrR family transcriptional repressor of nem operon
MPAARPESKAKLLDATLKVVREKGYSATRVEDVCAAAGVTKGSFFHHFKSKDDLALAAVAHWDAYTTAVFASAPYHRAKDPLARLLAYVDFRKSQLTGELHEYTCFAGTIIQEAYETHPAIAAAGARNVSDHAKSLEPDIRAAMRERCVKGDWSAESLALHIQGVIQGAFILAKMKGKPAPAIQSLEHLRRYLELLFLSQAKPARKSTGERR